MRGGHDEPYFFRHVLTQEAAYRALLERNRRTLHSLAADVLAAAMQPGSSGQWNILPELATHLTAAERHAEAHRCWCDLLYLAGRCGVLERAAEWEAAALASLQAAANGTGPPPVTSAQLELARAADAHRRMEHVAARAAYARACALAEQESDRLTECRALRVLGAFNSFLEEGPLGQTQLERSLSLARELGDRSAEAAALGELGNHAAKKLRQYGAALALQQAALAAAEAAGDQLAEASVMGNMANLYHSHLADPLAAEDCYRQSLTIQRTLGNRAGEAVACENLGSFYVGRGNLAEGAELLTAAMKGYSDVGDRPGVGSALAKLGVAQLWAGDTAAARTNLVRSHAILLVLPGEEFWLALTQSHLGDLEVACANPAAAKEWYDAALASSRQAGEPGVAVGALHGLAGLALAAGDLDEAERMLAAARADLLLEGRCPAEVKQELLTAQLAMAHAADLTSAAQAQAFAFVDAALDRATMLADEVQLTVNSPLREQLRQIRAQREALAGVG